MGLGFLVLPRVKGLGACRYWGFGEAETRYVGENDFDRYTASLMPGSFAQLSIYITNAVAASNCAAMEGILATKRFGAKQLGGPKSNPRTRLWL
jgi:hypothetical protein